MNKALVIGSSGFIGSNLMAMLGERGVAFDIKQGKSARSRREVGNALEGIDWVVHLAARGSGVQWSVEYPRRTLEDTAALVNVLDCCRRAGVGVLYASTAGALSGPPRSPYAACKAAGEAYCTAYRASYGLRTAVARFSNVYGPWSAHKATAIPAACRALLRDEVFVRYGDGSQVRDWAYVEDVCRGIVAALDAETTGTFNLGSASKQLATLNEVLTLLQKVSGRDLKIVERPARQGEAETKPMQTESYGPTTGLAVGLALTWEWFKTAK